ncbi:Kiwa anti-phage protein KwaB-like domain-containing protein, partial [Chitinivorax sp. PXF-14]|uniref:Kiwa anti-phage protein KwaB-like domain-containing protein n=1 Tax=Chitinivorax sp. PXF-14 TaxID=3230488 RepID=UPI003466F11A
MSARPPCWPSPKKNWSQPQCRPSSHPAAFTSAEWRCAVRSRIRVVTSSFSISRSFDFFVVGESVLMTSKPAFESLLNHKDTYEEAYAALKMEPGFSAAIADFVVFDAFIGKNATHLRRMAVIKARGYYNNPDYMARLREINTLRAWGIQ